MSKELEKLIDEFDEELKNTKFFKKWREILSGIEDLASDKYIAEEKSEKLERDIEDNYRRIPVSEQVGIYDEDFI